MLHTAICAYLHYLLFFTAKLHIALIAIIIALLFMVQLNKATPAQSVSNGVTVSGEKIVEFLLTLGNLKVQKRTGWINHKVDKPESIADHMYRLGLMGLCIQVCVYVEHDHFR